MPLADAAVWVLAVVYLVPSLTFTARRLLGRPWGASSAGSDAGDADAAFVADGGAASADLLAGDGQEGRPVHFKGLDVNARETDPRDADSRNAGESLHPLTASPSRAPALSEARLRSVVTLAAVAATVAAVGVLGRFASSAPGFALTLVVTLPILVALGVIDVDVHRLPNRLTGALVGVVILGLTVAPLVDGLEDGQARRAVVGALGLGAFYLVMALLGGGSGMGLGDVKLAPSLGALLAWAGWNTWLTGAVAAFFLGGVWGVVLMLRGQGRHARMPFGPFMLTGALVALCFA